MDPSSPTPEELSSHGEFLHRVARHLLGNAAQAEDLVQDAYLAALQAPERSILRPRRWLAHVIRQRGLNYRRMEQHRSEREREQARPEALPSHLEVAQRIELSQGLLQVIQGLSPDYRSVIYLRFYGGLSLTEIAERNSIPLQTVKTRQRRALEELRRVMDAEHGGDRRNWMQALLPLAGNGWVLRIPGDATAAATSTAFLGGALLMKKLVIALLLILSFVLGKSFFSNAPESPALADTGEQEEQEQDLIAAAPTQDSGPYFSGPRRCKCESKAQSSGCPSTAT